RDTPGIDRAERLASSCIAGSVNNVGKDELLPARLGGVNVSPNPELAAIPGGFGKAGDDRIPRVIIGGGIGDECGHGEVSTSGRVIMPMSSVAEDDWLARASPGSPHN